jgi:pyrroline-5-carboxylate reductase
MILNKGKLGVIGAGVMGQALIRGLLSSGKVPREAIWATAKSEASCHEVQAQLGITAFTDYQNVLAETDIILLCVKPSQVEKVLLKLKTLGVRPDTLVISIAAGASLAQLEETLATSNPVIRAMPNTPSIVGQGMTVVCGGQHATSQHIDTAKEIFEAVGHCMELDEIHFDAVTALCGSGPAYLFLIMEALADGGVKVGLPRDVAMNIVAQTVLGAASMVQKTGRHPAALRDDVTTPAGCTIAALLILEDGKIRSSLARAVEEATLIAGQLGQKK